MAHGDIKKYQLWITIFGCLPFPLTWLVFKLGAPSIVSYYIYVAVYWGLIFVRYYLVHGMTGIPAKMYLWGVVARAHLVAIVSAVLPLIIFYMMPETLVRLLCVSITCVLSSVVVIYTIGIDKAEQNFIRDKFLVRITKFCR
jgi:hypothetical protein